VRNVLVVSDDVTIAQGDQQLEAVLMLERVVISLELDR
jgi:hypothetical protein